MIKCAILTALSIMFLVNAVYAEIKLYLRPRVITANDLQLSDIALIESNNADIQAIKNISINSIFYQDGYIDKKEIVQFLKGYTDDDICIYGSAVKVVAYERLNELSSYHDQETENFILRKGDLVDIVVKKNGISIFLRGTALSEGKINDEVSIKLENKSRASYKLVKGRIKGKDLVEINI